MPLRAAEGFAAGHLPHVAGASNEPGVLLCPPKCEADGIHALGLASLARLALCTASEFALYMWQFQVCPPDAFAAILHPTRAERARATRRLRACWSAAVILSESLSTATDKHFRKNLMDDLYWAGTNPLVHESLSNGNINLIVGDAKQSIYRFKNGLAEQFVALPAIYNPELDESLVIKSIFFESQGFNRILKDNYRSSKNIVGFNNSFFEILKKSFVKFSRNYREIFVLWSKCS